MKKILHISFLLCIPASMHSMDMDYNELGVTPADKSQRKYIAGINNKLSNYFTERANCGYGQDLDLYLNEEYYLRSILQATSERSSNLEDRKQDLQAAIENRNQWLQQTLQGESFEELNEEADKLAKFIDKNVVAIESYKGSTRHDRDNLLLNKMSRRLTFLQALDLYNVDDETINDDIDIHEIECPMSLCTFIDSSEDEDYSADETSDDSDDDSSDSNSSKSDSSESDVDESGSDFDEEIVSDSESSDSDNENADINRAFAQSLVDEINNNMHEDIVIQIESDNEDNSPSYNPMTDTIFGIDQLNKLTQGDIELSKEEQELKERLEAIEWERQERNAQIKLQAKKLEDKRREKEDLIQKQNQKIEALRLQLELEQQMLGQEEVKLAKIDTTLENNWNIIGDDNDDYYNEIGDDGVRDLKSAGFWNYKNKKD